LDIKYLLGRSFFSRGRFLSCSFYDRATIYKNIVLSSK
jgi:hypothetical protein